MPTSARYDPDPRRRRYALLLGSLTLLFALRVAAQALQRWAPVDWLPPFRDFQGSGIPYWLLLALQVLIFAMMLAVTFDVEGGQRRRNPRASTMLRWIGGLYMAGSLGRIAVGLALPGAPAWFTTWIPAIFHVVLATFVLTLAAYHDTQSTAARTKAAR
jgi:hypothetical protein